MSDYRYFPKSKKKIVLFLLVFLCCTGCAPQTAPISTGTPVTPVETPTPPSPTVTPTDDDTPPQVEPFTWVRPSAEMFGFDGVYAQLYNLVVDYCNYDDYPTRCAIPEVKVFGIDEKAGAYYCIMMFTSLYYQEDAPSTLDVGAGGWHCKIDTATEGGNLVATDIKELRFDGLYDYTKEQLEKVPGLFEAYANQNAQPMQYHWETPAQADLVREYFDKTDYHFTNVLISGERVEDFDDWLDGKVEIN